MEYYQTELFPQKGQVFQLSGTGWYILCDIFDDTKEKVYGKCILIDQFNDVHMYPNEFSFPYDKLTQDIPLYMVETVLEYLSEKE